jgi:aldehyde dehydrogenase (NAD+)
MAMTYESRMLIDGKLIEASGGATYDNINPATEAVIGPVADGTAADMESAITAARRAFDETTWSTDPAFRKACLLQLKDALAAHREDLRPQIVAEVGAPIGLTYAIQQDSCIDDMQWDIDLIDRYEWEYELGVHEFFGMSSNRLVVREPIGVVGAITPWNYPLHQVVAKVAAALAAGCTVVLKPSEVAPLSAYALAEIFEQVGLPAGVFNLVTGLGPVVGERIVEHPDVDMVSFTGSTQAGKRVMALAAGTVKRVALELGGKSAFVILDDADLGKAVKVGLANCFINGGQTCTAWTRMLVPADKQDEVLELVRAAAGKYPVGAPGDEGTRIGPLANANQYKRVVGYIEQALADGATLVTGGPARPEGLEKGFYVQPTVLAGVRPGSRVEQEEVFGPVLAVIPYADEDEAVAIANGTPYGLAGGVFSGDQERAVRFARRMRTGMVDVNGGRFNALAPFGGYKQSGNGRELGEYGLEEFLEVKSLQL